MDGRGLTGPLHLGSKEKPMTPVPSATASELGYRVCAWMRTPKGRPSPPPGSQGNTTGVAAGNARSLGWAGGRWLPRLSSGGHMPATGRATFSTPTGSTPSPLCPPLCRAQRPAVCLVRLQSLSTAPGFPPQPLTIPGEPPHFRMPPLRRPRECMVGGWYAWKARCPPGDVWVWPQNPHGGAAWEQGRFPTAGPRERHAAGLHARRGPGFRLCGRYSASPVRGCLLRVAMPQFLCLHSGTRCLVRTSHPWHCCGVPK